MNLPKAIVWVEISCLEIWAVSKGVADAITIKSGFLGEFFEIFCLEVIMCFLIFLGFYGICFEGHRT